MKTTTVTLIREKETKNKFRYKETDQPDQPPLIQTLYLPKYLNPPASITVTVEPTNPTTIDVPSTKEEFDNLAQ